MKLIFKILPLLILWLSVATVVSTQIVPINIVVTDPKPRLTVRIDGVTATPYDSLVKVPVYIFYPHDSIAGLELSLRIPRNEYVQFNISAVGEDNLLMAADTAGGIMSGWEWVQVTSSDNSHYDLKISGMCDWPDQVRTPPRPPADSGLLVNLYFTINRSMRLLTDTSIVIDLRPERTGFSDPAGHSIGVVTEIRQECVKYKGDSCIAWKNNRVGYLDTNIVRLIDGQIDLIDSLMIETKPEIDSLEGKVNSLD